MALEDAAAGHGRDAGSSGCRRCGVSRQRVGTALLHQGWHHGSHPGALPPLPERGAGRARTEAGSAAPARRGASHPPGEENAWKDRTSKSKGGFGERLSSPASRQPPYPSPRWRLPRAAAARRHPRPALRRSVPRPRQEQPRLGAERGDRRARLPVGGGVAAVRLRARPELLGAVDRRSPAAAGQSAGGASRGGLGGGPVPPAAAAAATGADPGEVVPPREGPRSEVPPVLGLRREGLFGGGRPTLPAAARLPGAGVPRAARRGGRASAAPRRGPAALGRPVLLLLDVRVVVDGERHGEVGLVQLAPEAGQAAHPADAGPGHGRGRSPRLARSGARGSGARSRPRSRLQPSSAAAPPPAAPFPGNDTPSPGLRPAHVTRLPAGAPCSCGGWRRRGAGRGERGRDRTLPPRGTGSARASAGAGVCRCFGSRSVPGSAVARPVTGTGRARNAAPR